MYLWLIHFVMWQKPIQHCKAIILKLKINFKTTFLKKKKKKTSPHNYPKSYLNRHQYVNKDVDKYYFTLNKFNSLHFSEKAYMICLQGNRVLLKKY